MYGIILFSNRVVSLQSRYYSSSSSKKLLEILADMPKPNSARIASAQRQRQKITKKSEKYGPSTVYLQVLGSGAKGAPNTLYLFTDQKRYMFNCGECTQRLAHEHKVRLSKLDHIFITTKSWKNIGGLPGLSLTLQDVGVPNITLHGPKGLDELYNATKRFVIMKDMNVTMATCTPSEDFEDNVMTVKYVLIGNQNKNILEPHNLKHSTKNKKLDSKTENEFAEFIHDETDYYKVDRNPVITYDKEKVKSKLKLSPHEIMEQSRVQKVLETLTGTDNASCSVAYICTLKKRLGTLDLAKCVELGVKPGPMLGQLKNGFDVLLPNGKCVFARDVKTPDDPGPVFIVLDVPDITYIKEEDFQTHFNDGLNPPENIPVLIVHFTPPHVLDTPAYTNFIAKFGPTTQHLVLNSKNSCLGSEAVHRTQHKLHLLDPDIFPLLRDVSVPAVWNTQLPLPKSNSINNPVKMKGLEELKNKIALAQFQNIISLEGTGRGDSYTAREVEGSTEKLDLIAGRTLTIFHLRPKMHLDRSAEPKLHIQDYIQETMDVEGFIDSKQKFRNLVENIKYSKSYPEEYPRVVFLGTGSCIPSKTRNTSAIMVHVNEGRSILLDCGEGTYGQLVRFYGPKKVNAVLRTLKAIYISHLHADHHIGLIGVLQGRRQAFEELKDEQHLPVYLLAPGQIVTWLTLYDQQFEPIKDIYTLVPNQCLLTEAHAPNPGLTSAALAAMGVQGVETCLVPHCPNAFGVAIQMGQHKLTYSGDTLPCTELVKIGENSTLLIHEATMEDALAEEARTKMHSTTTQAIEIGKQMNARFTVLTHFSQRYARLPRLNAHILHNNNSIGIAFDNMQITMDDLKVLPHMYAPLQLMFADHCVEMELKAAHREQLREKRESSPPSLSGLILGAPKKSSSNWSSYSTGSKLDNRKRTLIRSPQGARKRSSSNFSNSSISKHDTRSNKSSIRSPQGARKTSSSNFSNSTITKQERAPWDTVINHKPVPPPPQTKLQHGRQSLPTGRTPRQSNNSIPSLCSYTCNASARSSLRRISTRVIAMNPGIGPALLVHQQKTRQLSPLQLTQRQHIRPTSLVQPAQQQQTKQLTQSDQMKQCNNTKTSSQRIAARSRSCSGSGTRLLSQPRTNTVDPELPQTPGQPPRPSHIRHSSLELPNHPQEAQQLSPEQTTQPENITQPSPIQSTQPLWSLEQPSQSQHLEQSSSEQTTDPQHKIQSSPIEPTQPLNITQSSPVQSTQPSLSPVQPTHPQHHNESSLKQPTYSLISGPLFPVQPTDSQSTRLSLPEQLIHRPQSMLSSAIQPTYRQQPRLLSPHLPIQPHHSRLSSSSLPIRPQQSRFSSGVRPYQSRLPSPIQPSHLQVNRISSPQHPTHPQQDRQISRLYKKQSDDSNAGISLSRHSSVASYKRNVSQLGTECETMICQVKQRTNLNSGVAKAFRPMGSANKESRISGYDNSSKSARAIWTTQFVEPKNKLPPASTDGYSYTKIPVSKNSPKPLKASLITNRKVHLLNSENYVKESGLQESVHEEDCVADSIGNEIDTQNELKSKLTTHNFATRPFRTTVMHSRIKDFKPQLEDIKSSFLLLNGKELTSESDFSTDTEGKKDPQPIVSKPNPFNEKMRIKLLQESKEKFRTRKFLTDSRYDKIEGLNWISWN